MSNEELRKRLERLNRGSLDASDAARSVTRGDGDAGAFPRVDVGLETQCPGRPVEGQAGAYYLVERGVADAGTAGRGLYDRFRKVFETADVDGTRTDLRPELAEALERGCEGLLFVDLETCGFSGTPVFLIGAMYAEGGALRVEQLLARTYAEERGILGRFSRLLERRRHLVTFNGKAFDWPFLADRAAVARVPLSDLIGHCDLLHNARRRYKAILPDCRLQTIEQYICGRRRCGDIAGRDIPWAYHAFVRSGDARDMRAILHHNYLDLVTLVEILTVLSGG